MENSLNLVNYLKGLSPLFEKLVERALEKNIFILTDKKFFRTVARNLSPPKDDKKLILGASHFCNRRSDKIIIVAWPEIKYNIINGELGLIELGFAHEIAHNLTWGKKPFCSSNPSLSSPPYIHCEYFEILAFFVGLQIIDEARHEIFFPEQPFFKGRHTTYLEILHHFDLPYCVMGRIKKCYGLKAHHLKKCPRTKEVKILVKKIEECKI